MQRDTTAQFQILLNKFLRQAGAELDEARLMLGLALQALYNQEPTTLFMFSIGSSRVHALPLAADRKVGDHYSWHFWFKLCGCAAFWSRHKPIVHYTFFPSLFLLRPLLLHELIKCKVWNKERDPDQGIFWFLQAFKKELGVYVDF